MVDYYVELSRNMIQNGRFVEKNAMFREKFEAQSLEEAYSKICEMQKEHTPRIQNGVSCYFNIGRFKERDSIIDIIGPRS